MTYGNAVNVSCKKYHTLTAPDVARGGHTVYARMHANTSPDTDVTAVADAIVKVVNMPSAYTSTPGQDGLEVVNVVADHIRGDFLHRIGLDDLLTPRVKTN